ncbi:MAG: formylglycine-generating enzyme family protein [Pirellulaceae bacterium]
MTNRILIFQTVVHTALFTLICAGCNNQPAQGPSVNEIDYGPGIPPVTEDVAGQPEPDLPRPEGMVWIPGGKFLMGSNDPEARDNEQPPHVVIVDGFYMDETEVTNESFAEFVEATGYVTIAEKKPELDDVMAQQPPGTPPPDPSVLVPGSMVFTPTDRPVSTSQPGDFQQWWRWQPDADWRHPSGPGSSLEGLDQHPVVQIAWDDAVAYCEWAGKRLPTEAEWEFAARGGLNQQPYVWGSDRVSDENPQANIWQGQFPVRNAKLDGYETSSPVKSFPPNGYGLYDMAGNVWEWCSDWFRQDTYRSRASRVTRNPTGPSSTDHPLEPRKAKRGGSFLCHRDYCSSYRPAARMSTSRDSGANHAGFRPVMTEATWRERLAEDAGPSKDGGPAKDGG